MSLEFDYATDDEFDETERELIAKTLPLFRDSNAGELALTGMAREAEAIANQTLLFQHKGRTYVIVQRRVAKGASGWEWRRVVAEILETKEASS